MIRNTRSEHANSLQDNRAQFFYKRSEPEAM